jgi:ABC-type multidrug transport system ATPase subunit
MVRLERFEKRYGKFQAVKPLDLSVRRGESFAFLGPNGSGKTTIIRALVGLHAPSAGRVWIDGFDVVRSPQEVKQRLSYVPQRVSMPDMLTAREVVTLFAALRRAAPARVDEALELFALDDVADRRVFELSGGMVQRLGLAVAFVGDVPLLVLDEPTLNLDLLGVERLQHLLAELKQKGTTIVFSSHLLRHAMQLADRVAVLVEGELVNVAEMSVFHAAVTSQTLVHVSLGNSDDAVIAAARAAGADLASRNGHRVAFRAEPERRLEVIRAMEQAGGKIEEFHTEAPDWEDLIRRQFDAKGEDA